jgi:hypothetical protein
VIPGPVSYDSLATELRRQEYQAYRVKKLFAFAALAVVGCHAQSVPGAAHSPSRSAAIEVRIRRADISRPWRGSVLLLRLPSDTIKAVLVDMIGVARFDRLAADSYRLLIRSIGLQRLVVDVNLRSGCQAEVDALLQPYSCDIDPNCVDPPSRALIRRCERLPDEQL